MPLMEDFNNIGEMYDCFIKFRNKLTKYYHPKTRDGDLAQCPDNCTQELMVIF